MIHSRMETEGYSMEHYKDYSKLLLEINRLMQKGNIIIAIDGGSASGKTTLSKMLEKEYSATVFHMDDFFLRPLQRTKERLATPGGNIDWERFLEEVLIPLKNNESISYRKFDCSTFTLSDFIAVNPSNASELIIVEGAYSMHPELAKYYDYSVFLDISSSMQRERIMKRNSKEKAKRFFEEWIPMENCYFEELKVKERCDMVLEIE